MRSTVTRPRPAGGYEERSAWQFPTPNPQHQFSQINQSNSYSHKQQKRRLVLAPAEGWFVFILLGVAVYSVVTSVTLAINVNHSFILLISTVAGLLIGLGVAKIQRFPQSILHIAACLVGHWLSIWLTSAIAYHISWLALLASLRDVITGGLPTSGTPGGDIIFLFYLSFLCFFLGYFGAWLVYRAHLPWLVAMVYCAIMVVNLNYIAKQDLSYLLVILMAALILLIARVQLVNQLAQWAGEGLHTDRPWLRNITRRFIYISALFMVLVLSFSWILPIPSQPRAGVSFWDQLDNAWNNITHGHLSPADPGSLFQVYQSPANFFGDALAITGSVNLPTGTVLSYTDSANGQGQYLEGFTYDHFDGHTWTSQISSLVQSSGPNSPLQPDAPGGNYTQVNTSITIVQPPQGTKPYIFGPAQPTSFSVPVIVYNSGTPGITTAWTQSSPLTQNEQYQVTSSVSSATPGELASIPLPQDAPDLWANDVNNALLQQSYLQTPGDLPPSVLSTARQWTQNATNPYAIALALESHLKDPAHFTYSTSNPPVPGNIDAVAWLLQTHQGYCTYYASAMAIMARLLHIPARVANGFSQGHLDAQHKEWIVDGNDAHSWVQIYFPGYGWINFDPTPGYAYTGTANPHPAPSPVTTPSPTGANPTPTAVHPIPTPHPTQGTQGGQPGTQTSAGGMFTGQNLFLTVALFTLASSLIVLFFAIARYRSRADGGEVPIVSAMYDRICRLASFVGLPPQQWQTPYEYAHTLSQRLPHASPALRRVTDLFVRERWAAPHQAPRAAEHKDVERLWPYLRNALLRLPFTGRK